ncbi:MAG: hypothetical protein ACP5HM_16855 [Anaerolineae bacterium]
MRWETYEDAWHGVRLEHPAEWTVHAEPGAARVRVAGEPWNWVYGGWIGGASRPTAEAAARQLLARLRSQRPSLRGFRAPDAGVEGGLLLRLEASSPQGPLAGALRVLTSSELMLVQGFLAERTRVPEFRPAFERILTSFRPQEPVPRRPWRDPTEGAFTVAVPPDWGVQGGVRRDPQTGFGQLFFHATADEQGITALQISTAPQIFVEGGGLFGMGMPGVPAYPYCDVAAFVEQFLLPQLQQVYPGASLEALRPLPEVRRRLQQEALQLGMGQQPLRLDAAEVTLFYTEQGVLVRQKQEMHTFETPAMPMSPRFWVAETPWSYRAPSADFERWEPLLSGMAASFEIAPAWQQREAGLRQQQVMAANRRTQQLQMMTFWKISRDQDLIADMSMASYERRSAAQDRMGQAWSDAVLGQRDLATPSGDVIYGVESGFHRYWTNALGEVLASDSWLFEPGGHWEEIT